MALFPALTRLFQRILRRDPAEPQDPYARVLVPVRRGTGGRSAAVAIEEPEEPLRVNAFGGRSSRAK